MIQMPKYHLSDQVFPHGSIINSNNLINRMGSEKRAEPSGTENNSKFPGPGQYAIKNYIGQGPKIVMASRPKEDKLGNVHLPGPGAYQPNLSAIIEKPFASGLGYGKRNNQDLAKLANPGPGSYAINRDHKDGPKYGFGKSKRSEEKKQGDSPGPGNYQIPGSIGEVPAFEKSKHI